VSTKADELIRRAAIGERVKQIRDALELNGEEFADAYERAAKALGLTLRFDKYKLSRLEGGGRKLTAEEVVLLVQLDPEGRDVQWLVFGADAASPVAAVAREPLQLEVAQDDVMGPNQYLPPDPALHERQQSPELFAKEVARAAKRHTDTSGHDSAGKTHRPRQTGTRGSRK